MGPVRILHLSDLHLEAGADVSTLLHPLEQDIRDPDDGMGLDALDGIVVSGDLTNRATPEEFDSVRLFLEGLLGSFSLTPEALVIIPGNHDQCWDPLPYAYRRARHVDDRTKRDTTRVVAQGDGFLVRDDALWSQRFANFSSQLYQPLLGRPWSVDPAAQVHTAMIAGGRVQVLALNSAWEIDELFPERSAIHDGAVSRVIAAADAQRKDTESSRPPGARPVRIVTWHHPPRGAEQMASDAFLERLRKADVAVCLHGHVHEVRAELVGYTDTARQMHVIGAGSFGAPAKDRPESTPSLYNVIELDPALTRAKVHTRGRDKPGGAFSGRAIWRGEDKHSKRSYYELSLADRGWGATAVSSPEPGGSAGPASTARPPPAAHTRLTRLLAVLFSRRGEITMLLRDSGIDPGRIDLDGAALVVWSDVLDKVAASGELDQLLEAARAQYPNRARELTLSSGPHAA
jgi:3',5'-cyclic AMP phosphodiesterase CpdA